MKSLSLQAINESSSYEVSVVYDGIFTTIDNKRVKGGMPQTPARMLARMSLVNIAQSNIHKL